MFCQAKCVLCEWIKLNQVNYAWIVFLAFYFLALQEGSLLPRHTIIVECIYAICIQGQSEMIYDNFWINSLMSFLPFLRG